MKTNDLINDLKTFGFLFEFLCIRDLKVYTQSYDGNISFYRDETDFEVDAIITTSGGKWGAIEIKLGANYSYKREDGVYVVSIGTLKN